MTDKGRTAATLLLASMTLPSARQLAAVAMKRHWAVCALDEKPSPSIRGIRTFYGGTDRAAEYATKYNLCLLEPPLDLLARMPRELLCREVCYGSLSELATVRGPVFVKPADPIFKCFDAGVYRSVSEVSGRRPIPGDTAVLVAEVIEWTSEFRCFIRMNQVEAWSPYLSYGRPVWKPGSAGAIPKNVMAFCQRLIEQMPTLPPAFVVDVGVLEDGRWAIVEFNPAWCSAILGGDVNRIFDVIERAAYGAESIVPNDHQWLRLGKSSMGRKQD